MLFFLANAVNRLIIASKKISGIHNRLGLGIPPILYFYLVVKDIFFPLETITKLLQNTFLFFYPNISTNSENVSATLYVTGAKSSDSSWLHTQIEGFSLLFL